MQAEIRSIGAVQRGNIIPLNSALTCINALLENV